MEPKLLNFSTALELLKQGLKVCRADWPSYISMRDGKILHGEYRTMEFIAYNDDLLAEDWLIQGDSDDA